MKDYGLSVFIGNACLTVVAVSAITQALAVCNLPVMVAEQMVTIDV